MSWVRVFVVIFAINFFAGCTTYFKRKDCEGKNWQEYGYGLAMKGVRPGEDSYVAECRKVEAEFSESSLDLGFKSGMAAYCKPDQAFLTGKKGQKINLDFCESGLAKILIQKHKEGVKVYCSGENAYIEGSSGHEYTGICPAEMESAFNKEFRRGRKKFVQGTLVDLQNKFNEKSAKISSIRQENDQLAMRLAMLPQPRTIVERTYDPISKSMREDVKTEDPYIHEKERLRREIDSNRYKAESEEREQSKIREEISKYQTELLGLE